VKLLLIATVAFLVSSPPHRAFADEWGCEVLLCAASADPSWHSVPQCHSPMGRLIQAMKKPGFSWPTCPEGGSGKPGYERFEDCPPGWTATGGGSNPHQQVGLNPLCMRTGNDCDAAKKRFQELSERRLSKIDKDEVIRIYRNERKCEYVEYSARPRREKPYYFDVVNRTTASRQRFYFDLQD